MENAKDSVPQNQTEAQTSPVPYAVETFADIERGKLLTTLHFRRKSHDRAVAVGLIPDVLDQLVGAGLTLTRPVEITVGDKLPCICILKAAVDVPADGDGLVYVEALRRRWSK